LTICMLRGLFRVCNKDEIGKHLSVSFKCCKSSLEGL
jgi:hypothetical protein